MLPDYYKKNTHTHINNTTYTLTKPFWKILPSENRKHLSVERKYRDKLELREELREKEKDIMFNFPFDPVTVRRYFY